MKKLLATFKACFSTDLEKTYGEKSFRDPFICVNIKCSPGSYDPNIEPSKHVVLFANESQVTELFERLCSEVYKSQQAPDPFMTIGKRGLRQGSELPTPPISSDGPGVEDIAPTIRNSIPLPDVCQSDARQPGMCQPAVPHQWPHERPQEVQRTRLPSSPTRVREQATKAVPQRRPGPVKMIGGLAIDMSADPDMSSDEDNIQEETVSQVEEEEEEEGSRAALNPWVIAKMNAPTRQEHTNQVQQPLPISDEVFENLPILRPFGEAPGDLAFSRDARFEITTGSLSQQIPGFHHPLGIPTVGDPTGEYLIGPGTSRMGCDALQPPSRMNEANGRRTLPLLRSYNDQGPEDPELDGLDQARLSFGGQPRRSQKKRDGET